MMPLILSRLSFLIIYLRTALHSVPDSCCMDLKIINNFISIEEIRGRTISRRLFVVCQVQVAFSTALLQNSPRPVKNFFTENLSTLKFKKVFVSKKINNILFYTRLSTFSQDNLFSSSRVKVCVQNSRDLTN
jgi:hypothetical protein